MAGVAAAIEVVAGYAVVGTFTLSTVPEDRASAAAHYSIMLACAATFLLLAVGYWSVVPRARAAAVLMAVTGALTALGLWTWLLTPALVVTAVVVSFVRAKSGVSTPSEQHGPERSV